MEPQLRRAGGPVSGKGTGTPFNPFDPFAADDSAGVHVSGATSPEPADEAAAAEKTHAAAEKTRAAAFNRGSRRGRRRTDPPAG
jgi:hypothetical protein